MNELERHIVEGIGAPLAIGTVAFAAVWWRRRGPASGDHPPGTPAAHDPTWAAPALLMLVYCVFNPLLLGAPSFPPRSANDWFPVAAVVAGVLGIVADSVRLPGAAKWLVRWAVLVGLFAGCAANAIRARWTGLESAMWVGGGATLTVVAWWCMAHLNNTTRGARGPIVAGGLCAAAGGLLVLTGSLRSAQGVGFVAAAMTGALLVSWVRPRLTIARGGAHVPVVLTGVSLFAGVVFGDAAWWQAALVLFIPVAAIVAGLALPVGIGGWKRTVAVAVAAAIPGAAVVGPQAMEELEKQRAGERGHGGAVEGV